MVSFSIVMVRSPDLNEEQGLQGTFISAIEVAKEGAIWVGTEKGLFKKQGPKFSRILLNQEGSHFISALLIDSSSRSWVATRDGELYVREGNQWKTIRLNAYDESAYILTLLMDFEGNVWFGTDTGGVGRIRFDASNQPFIDDYLLLEELEGNPVVNLFQDAEASIWIGTAGSGVIQMRPGKFRITLLLRIYRIQRCFLLRKIARAGYG